MTRYVVIGAGAVGGALAATLHEAGIAQVLVARGETYLAIRDHGLRYTRPSGTRTFHLEVAGAPEDVELTGDDTLLLATKAQDTETALAAWAWQPVRFPDRVGTASELPLVVLQNGLDGERTALRRFRTVFGAVVLVPGNHTEPGVVVTAAAPRIGQVFVGPYPAAAPHRPTAIVADLDAAGWLAQEVDDVSRWKAWKILHNVHNAVELLTGAPDRLAALRDRLTAEAAEVLAAEGVEVADPAAERTHDPSLAAFVPGVGYAAGRQSTWQSVARGVPHEVDYLNGEIVLRGRLHGVATPCNEALQQVLGAAGLRHEPPGAHDVEEVFAHADRVDVSRPLARHG